MLRSRGPRSKGQREGSPFTGLGPVFIKELSDHLSSTRMMVLTLFVIVFGALPVGFARGLPVVAVADPTDEDAMHGASSILHSARFVASSEEAILYQLPRVYVSSPC